jgi:ABC-type multidrug transport system fused ATPase/permease subunit
MRNRWQRTALALSLKLLSKSEKRKIILVLFLQICMGFLDLLAIAFIGVLGSLAVTGVSSRSPGNRVDQTLNFIGLSDSTFQFQVGVLGITAAILMILRTLLSMYFSRKILLFLSVRAAIISRHLLAKMLSQSLLFIQGRTSQQTLFSLTSGVSAITIGIIGTAINVVADVSLMLVMLIGLFLLDPVISTAMMLGLALVGYILYQTMHRKARRLGRDLSALEISSSESIFEVISTYREAIVKNRRSFYVEKIGNLRYTLADSQAQLAFMPNISKYVIESVVLLGSLILCAVQFSLQDATQAVATLAVFLTSATRIAPAALRVQQASIQLKSNIGSAGPTLQLIEDLSKMSPEQIPKVPDDESLEPFLPEVCIDDVTVTYPNSNQPALEKISIRVSPGELIGVTGLSGSGKSTLVDALLGIIPIDSGEVTISGVSPETAIRMWPGKIGYVPQSVAIIPGSVLQNIALGLHEDDVLEEKAWVALKLAKLSEYVSELPNGLNTVIGEGGAGLSGGQRQRLGIARALYSQPSLLILDEATSSLDSKTEKLVSESIDELHGEMTVIVIAHRLSTILKADRIVFLEDGKVNGIGNFETLKSRNSTFQKLAQDSGL